MFMQLKNIELCFVLLLHLLYCYISVIKLQPTVDDNSVVANGNETRRRIQQFGLMYPQVVYLMISGYSLLAC